MHSRRHFLGLLSAIRKMENGLRGGGLYHFFKKFLFRVSQSLKVKMSFFQNLSFFRPSLYLSFGEKGMGKAFLEALDSVARFGDGTNGDPIFGDTTFGSTFVDRKNKKKNSTFSQGLIKGIEISSKCMDSIFVPCRIRVFKMESPNVGIP